jgi:bifunctional DNA-binding transcriptional regulator/antitoxin component of YhaV-PrlF toxin-antitoxin module
MSDVKVRKGQVTIPTRIRTRLGIADGAVLDMKVRSNCVVLTRKAAIDYSQFPNADDEYTPAQRKIVDAELAKGIGDVKMGRTFGPFDTAEELIASMRREGKKLAAKKKKANS